MPHDRFATSSAHRLRQAWRFVRHHGPAALLLVLLAPLVLAAAWVAWLVPQTPAIGDLKKLHDEKPSIVLSADGQQLAVLRKANREWVPLADISPAVVAALLATEDRRFYEHGGLDWRRTLAAAYNTLRGRLQGGSTLTQQLARNLYPEEIGRSPTLERKAKEAITALKIERVYGKDEILEIYLNTVPFLYNAWGIEMAARTYFDKRARELDVLESATLVGMLKGTSYYNPVLNPGRAQQRRNTVLARMAAQGELDPAQLQALQAKPLRVQFERQDEQLGPAPHFVVQVRRWLIDWADRNGYDIYADGLVVRTSIDSRVQQLAAQALAHQSDRLQKLADAGWSARNGWTARRELVDAFIRESARYQAERAAGRSEPEALARLRADTDFMRELRSDKTRLQSGFLAMEPGSGLVRAWVGSRDFEQDQFDHVAQARRQPGSTFKPFVYGAAFELGARPTDLLLDQPVEIALDNGDIWRPSDGSAPTGQPVMLRDGLAFSKNTITAQLMQRIGAPKVAALARAMGVRDSRLAEVISLGLGTSPVTLREMVAAYGTIANDGRYVAPRIVLQVEDSQGKVLEAFPGAPAEPALSSAANGLLLDAMRGVVAHGTGAAIRTQWKLPGDLAGKTGTTQENTDGWFILVHPQLVAGAWVGYNDARLTMPDAWGQGARSALPMVGEFFQQLLRTRMLDARARFPTPADPALLESVNAWWASMFPPVIGPELAALPAVEAAGTGPIPAVVVAPPPAGMAPDGGILARAVERAIVVAPPRDAPNGQPPGEASGAGAAPPADIGNSYINP